MPFSFLVATASSDLDTDLLKTLSGIAPIRGEARGEMEAATENRLRVWFLRHEDLIATASARIRALPAYAR